MRTSPAEYLRLDLRAHELLRGVPLHDVSMVELPGGGAGRSVADVRALRSAAAPGGIVRALFALRFALGRAFGWDRVSMRPADSLVTRLTEEDRRASEVVPGTPDGPFRIVYQFPREALSEIRNATVQAYLCFALTRTATGYRLYWAVYVRPVSWLTRPYLLAIEPFRRYIVYPALLGRIRAAWLARYGAHGA